MVILTLRNRKKAAAGAITPRVTSFCFCKFSLGLEVWSKNQLFYDLAAYLYYLATKASDFPCSSSKP